MKWTIVTGNAFDDTGLTLHGVFNTYDEALSHAENHFGNDWSITEIQPVKAFEIPNLWMGEPVA